jgi:prophage maintenance system killer protein
MNKGKPTSALEIEHFLVILYTAQQIHNKHGEPIPNIGSESIGKIDACLKTPFQIFGGINLYKTFNRKASALFYFLIKNHCLQNGNKRMAILTLSFFIFHNHRSFVISQRCLYSLAKQTSISENKENALHKISKTLKKSIRNRSQSMTTIQGAIEGKRIKKKNKLRIICLHSKLKIQIGNYIK